MMCYCVVNEFKCDCMISIV